MTEIDVDRRVQPTLRSRGAGQSAMQRCLELQRDAPELGSVARVLGRSPLHPDAVADYRAALAELETGRRLAALGADFTVLHSVPVGATAEEPVASGGAESDDAADDADSEDPRGQQHPVAQADERSSGSRAEQRPIVGQLVIGPGGVFCVASATSLTASGVDRAAREARLASKHLSRALQRVIAVTPVLSISGGWSPTPGDPQPVVDVVASRALPEWLTRRGRVLTIAESAVLAMTAEQPTTWRALDDGTLPPMDASGAERFRTLDTAVDAASARRQLVLVVAAVVTIAVWLGVAASVVTSMDPQVLAR